MPPITIVFIATGLVVWLNALYFLGVGADQKEGGSNPLVGIGHASFLVGVLNLVQAVYIMWARPLDDASVVVAGLVTFYGLFFVVLGKTEMNGWDLRVVGNLAIPTAILPLFWWDAVPGEWMMRSILIVWLVAFGSVALTTYGKLEAKLLGVILAGTAIYTFWVPALILATGNDIP
ncbi:MAG: hypothetical protein OXC06_15035 [Acidimicrobiaceae bacterium]|nr:hypothetical protein [Acidimicrobiaceae bacterium]